MEKEFAGKSVLITGATSGIGKATALRFAEAGADIVAIGRDRDALTELQSVVEKSGARCLSMPADLTRPNEPERAVSTTVNHFGGIDVLVNAAGHISSGTIENTTNQAWDAMLEINLRSPFLLMRAATPSLIERKGMWSTCRA